MGIGIRNLVAGCCVLVVLGLLAGGCGSSDSSASGGSDGPGAEKLEITWQKPASKEDRAGYEVLKASEAESLAEAVADRYELPNGLKIEGVNGDGSGPVYNPEDSSITLPYGFAAMASEAVAASSGGSTEKELDDRIAGLNDLILEHAIGHALIAAYELPAAKAEEDVADEIGVSLLLERPAGAKQVTGTAIFLANFSNRGEPPELTRYVQAHGLDLKHALDILCWSAGSSKEAHKEVTEIGAIGDASYCPKEYEKLASAVAQDLDPHLK